ncbi:MAG: sugar phosphate isomerase/epimerase family protein [Acutalibacteraceae bacterium]
MKIGISTACMYPNPTEEALDILLNCGFSHFEIFFNTISEINPHFINILKAKLKNYGATVKSMHPFTSGYEPYLLFTDYTRRYRDTLKFYENYFKTAAMLGAKLLVIHGDRKTPEIGGISNKEYFEKFAELSLLGEKYGVTVAQENVNLFRSQRIDFIKEMKEYLGDRAKFVFDIKQSVRSGADPYEMCTAMGESIVHIHINDNKPGCDCLLPGKGTMDYNKLFRILSDNSFTGDLIIEVYRTNFTDADELVSSYEFLKKEVKKSSLFTLT